MCAASRKPSVAPFLHGCGGGFSFSNHGEVSTKEDVKLEGGTVDGA